MITTISNSTLTATINHRGAELVSLQNISKREYIWEGDSAFWGKHSPVLFPIVGTLRNNQYNHNGKIYTLSRHGFASSILFELIDKSENHAVFSLINSTETLQCYPFEFELQIHYTLWANNLKISYHVINRNSFPMPFSIGAHPAFALPKSFEDYDIVFEKEEELISYPLENNLISNHSILLPIEKNKLPLTYSLFENDAIVLKKLKSNFVDLIEENNPIIRIRFEDFPSLGIWTKKDAPFICIEPWIGYSDTTTNSGNLSEKEGIRILSPWEVFNAKLNIEIS